MRVTAIAALMTGMLLCGAAQAQLTPSPGPGLAPAAPTGPGAAPPGTIGSTATGGLPAKTDSTTSTGTTKPPGTTLGPELGTRPDLEQKSRQLDTKIDRGICSGCK